MDPLTAAVIGSAVIGTVAGHQKAASEKKEAKKQRKVEKEKERWAFITGNHGEPYVKNPDTLGYILAGLGSGLGFGGSIVDFAARRKLADQVDQQAMQRQVASQPDAGWGNYPTSRGYQPI